MDIQRIRNLTTLILHTKMEHIYQDIEYITGEQGIMTHHLGMACDAMKPWLMGKLKDPRFWDGSYDKTHTGEIDLAPMTKEEHGAFVNLFLKQPESNMKSTVIIAALFAATTIPAAAATMTNTDDKPKVIIAPVTVEPACAPGECSGK